MTRSLSIARRIFLSEWFSISVFLCWGLFLASLISTLFIQASFFAPGGWNTLTILPLDALLFTVVLLTMAGTFIVVTLNRRTTSYRLIGKSLHDINHYLRDYTEEIVNFEKRDKDWKKALLNLEREVLTIVCRKAGLVFGHLTGKDCSVSVFLKYSEGGEIIPPENEFEALEGGLYHAFLWAVGSHSADRKNDIPENEKVEEGTVFYSLSKKRTDGINRIEHFILDNDFRTSLSPSGEYYKTKIFGQTEFTQPGSLAMVPIRCNIKTDGKVIDNCIGYLSVECVSKNRFWVNLPERKLGWSEHIQYLSAFSDQIYSIISHTRSEVSSDE